MIRPDWDDWAMFIARAWARRGDCTRRQVGAVIFDRDHRQVGAGYNGAPPGMPGCLEGACPRGRHYPVSAAADERARCACGDALPCSVDVAPGSDYGNCISLHAEVNAVVDAGRRAATGGTIYVTEQPCSWCFKVIQAAGIVIVITPGEIIPVQSRNGLDRLH